MTSAAQPLSATGKTAAARAVAALRTETGLARLALGIAAVHVADDNFLQPEPGTTAGDHLVGGLVQVAFLVLAAWVYPRLRPGARGTLAVLVGLFVVVMGVGEAGYYTRESGPSGDDFTGLLTIPAGLLLVGVGLVTLWRSRKGGSPVRRYVRRGLLAVGFVLAAYLVVYPVSEAYVVTHSARAYVPAAELGTAYEDVVFTTGDGLRLAGWYVPSENGASVIVFPGRKGTQAPARMLARHGYGVLLFDRRGEGESEGDPNGYGWRGSRDLQAAISFLQARPEVDDDRIGGLGLSVGGEMLLQAAAETDDLKAVVSEGAGIRSVREAVHVSGSDRWLTVPVTALTTAATAVFTSDLPPRSLTDLSAEIAAPVLFVYATPGQGGESLNPTYYAAAREPKEIWAAEGGHTGAITAEPEEYERRVLGFFDSALLGDK
jgi:dienelactone hydrolase